jgi:hypothetical protein
MAKYRQGYRKTKIAMSIYKRGQIYWRDVEQGAKLLTLRESKTDQGKRTIPLNEAALAACAS